MLSFPYENGKIHILNIIKTNCNRTMQCFLIIQFFHCSSSFVFFLSYGKKERRLQLWTIATVDLLLLYGFSLKI